MSLNDVLTKEQKEFLINKKFSYEKTSESFQKTQGDETVKISFVFGRVLVESFHYSLKQSKVLTHFAPENFDEFINKISLI